MNLMYELKGILGCDQDSLTDGELALVTGGELGGYVGSSIYGSPVGFGGFGTVAGPWGNTVWSAFSGPAAFRIWAGTGFTNVTI
jgi:hypothetical protein